MAGESGVSGMAVQSCRPLKSVPARSTGGTVDASPTPSDRVHEYERLIRSRLRWANLAAMLRAFFIQLSWLVVLFAGAAVPLSDALGAPGWVSPTLGFVVVAGAGLERIFSRASDAAVAVEELRRSLARERRAYLTAQAVGHAGSDEEAFAIYRRRVEEAMAAYDRRMVEYHSRLLKPSS